MSSQTQRGIPLITPLSLRRGMGRGCFLPPSPFREGRGEAVSGVLQASSGICSGCFEIPLQITHHYCSQINSLSLKIVFVTYRESVSYKEASKRCPFALQNMPFYTSKDALLHCKRASFTTQKGVDGKTRRKEIDKAASPSPSERRGCERIRWDMGGSLSLELQPPQPPYKGGDVPGGIRNAVGWGDGRRKKSG